jgi:hypothetical protein
MHKKVDFIMLFFSDSSYHFEQLITCRCCARCFHMLPLIPAMFKLPFYGKEACAQRGDVTP